MFSSEYWLILITLMTSILSGATGLGGGVILIGMMGSYFTPSSIIPIHSMVQFFGNMSRCVFSFRDIRRDIIVRYISGAVVGAIAGSFFVFSVSERYLWLFLGSFLLLMTWLPLSSIMNKIHWKYSALGGISTTLSLFVGITGPMLHPVLKREQLDKHAFIGTESACAGFTHFLKIIVFASAGFSFFTHWMLIVPMILVSILGSFLGKKILNRIPQKTFYLLINLLITFLAIRMILKFFS